MEIQISFPEVVHTVFKGWNSLQFIMDRHSGMRMTNDLFPFMVEAMVTFFEKNDDLEEEEVSWWLYELVSKNTDVQLDDNSPEETAQILCKTYTLLQQSRFDDVRAELSKLPSYDPCLFTVQADDEGQAGLAAVANVVNGDDYSSESDDDEPRELTEQEKLELDGWTSVKSRLRNNKLE